MESKKVQRAMKVTCQQIKQGQELVYKYDEAKFLQFLRRKFIKLYNSMSKQDFKELDQLVRLGDYGLI